MNGGLRGLLAGKLIHPWGEPMGVLRTTSGCTGLDCYQKTSSAPKFAAYRHRLALIRVAPSVGVSNSRMLRRYASPGNAHGQEHKEVCFQRANIREWSPFFPGDPHGVEAHDASFARFRNGHSSVSPRSGCVLSHRPRHCLVRASVLGFTASAPREHEMDADRPGIPAAGGQLQFAGLIERFLSVRDFPEFSDR